MCGHFLTHDFGGVRFDAIVSAAMLHHAPPELAVARTLGLLRPDERLVLNDVRADAGALDRVRSGIALAHAAARRLLRTGRALSPPPLREAWRRHGAGERYLTMAEARTLASRLLPGARVHHHWLWHYTIVWDAGGSASIEI